MILIHSFLIWHSAHKMKRIDIVSQLKKENLIGIELGVAKGTFSKQLFETGLFREFYGVDRYTDRGHDMSEYFNVLKMFKDNPNVYMLRSTFDEAITLFRDNYFDFIYVDGYAHTGQDEGSTLYSWFDKLKPGGIFAGHDYCLSWNKTVEEVDKFVKDKDLFLHITESENLAFHEQYPSWWTIK